MTTTTAPMGAQELPIWVISDDAALLARADKALQGKHVACELDQPDPEDPRGGVVELWSTGDPAHVVALQRLLAGAGIPSVTVCTTETPADLDAEPPELA